MSQLTQNTVDLDALIDKANALPDAGSGGGGGTAVETCTVITPSYFIGMIAATIYENGTLSVACIDCMTPRTFTIENVVCGSMLAIGVAPSFIISADGAEFINKSSIFNDFNSFKITAQAEETVTFTFMSDM